MKKLLLSFILIPATAISQIVITGAGSTTQNFDALLNTGSVNPWTDNALIPGWYSQRTTPSTLYGAGTGSSSTGGLYSYGSTGSTERALGTIGSSNLSFGGDFAHGVQFHNTSGDFASAFTVSFTMEQWRNGGSASSNELTFWYMISSTTMTSLDPGVFTGWTQVTALSTDSPIITVGASALDGNLPANQVVVSSVVIPGLILADGEYLMLKWDDPDHSGTDHGLSIDDVTISWSASCPTVYYEDSDADGLGDLLSTTTSCVTPTGYVTNSDDCDDTDNAIGAAQTFYLDSDGDGLGSSTSTLSCTQPVGYVTNNTDCDDGNIAIGAIQTYYLDADGDTYGSNTSTTSCTPVAGYVLNNTDCNDANAALNPGAAEICNLQDDNCNASIDDGLVFVNYFIDADGDNYGTGTPESLCSNPGAGYATVDGDCDDSDNTVYPGATEICDGQDNDCANGSDDGLTFTDYYTDADGDTYGTGAAQSLCSNPGVGFATVDGDCDDSNANAYPGATEIADNGVDENCDLIDNYASIDQQSMSKVSVFPNPTNGLVTLTFNQELSDAYVVITNVLGEEVYSENISGIQKHELNLDNATGIYFVNIYDQGNLITVMKVVKQ
jgi:hypothetical protein